MYYLYDYHVHTTHSTDGKSSLFDVCQSAVEKGLNEIAITDHFEPTLKDEAYRHFDANIYSLEIEKVRELFEGKLKIKMGVELGQPHLFINTSNSLVNSQQFDYVIGSAHKLPSGIDVSEINYDTVKLEDICQMYLNQIKQLAVKADFDCVGHMDLIKRYSTSKYKKRVTLAYQEELLREVLKVIIVKGKGIEINTSGLRQSPKETMPGVDVLKIYKELGGEILTIGSDAHYAKDVAKGLDVAMENAKEAGFKYLTQFTRRTPEWRRISYNNDLYYIDMKDIV